MALLEGFGSSKDAVWSQLCRQLGGDYDEGGFFKSGKVNVSHNDWTITLDSYTTTSGNTYTTYTRIICPYINRDGFRFKIYRKSIFSGIGKLLGMQDVEVGYPQFDEDFIIKGNNKIQLKKLFDNAKIRDFISLQPKILFEVKNDARFFIKKYPREVDLLYFEAIGVIKDIHLLKELFDLFAEVLDHLCRIGAASPGKPI